MNSNWNPFLLGQSSASRPLTFYNFPILTPEQQLSGLEQQLAAVNQHINGGSARASQVGPGSNLFRSFLKRLTELQQMAARVHNLSPNHSSRHPLSQYEAARRPPATQALTRGVHIGSTTAGFLVAATQLRQIPVSDGMYLRPVFPNHYSNIRYAVAPISQPARTLEVAPLLVTHEAAMGGGGVQGSPVATNYPRRHLSPASEANLLAMLSASPPQGVKRKREEEAADRKGKRAMGAGPSNAPPDAAVEGGQNGGHRRDDDDDDDDDLIMVDLDLKLGCP